MGGVLQKVSEVEGGEAENSVHQVRVSGGNEGYGIEGDQLGRRAPDGGVGGRRVVMEGSSMRYVGWVAGSWSEEGVQCCRCDRDGHGECRC